MLTSNPARNSGVWPQNQRSMQTASPNNLRNNVKMLIIVDREPCRTGAPVLLRQALGGGVVAGHPGAAGETPEDDRAVRAPARDHVAVARNRKGLNRVLVPHQREPRRIASRLIQFDASVCASRRDAEGPTHEPGCVSAEIGKLTA